MAQKTTKKGNKMGGKRGQPAIEYLVTYGWALLILAVIAVALYLFVNAPTNSVPQGCTLETGAACQDIAIGSTSPGVTNAMLLFTNSQSIAVANPTVIVNANNNGNGTAACTPTYILPGGSITCSVTIPGSYSQGQLLTAKLYLNVIPCATGNAMTCYCPPPVTSNGFTTVDIGCPYSNLTISGTATTQYQASIVQPTPTITLTSEGGSMINTGTADNLVAYVTVGGVAVGGASITFNAVALPANVPATVTFNPSAVVTDNNGNGDSSITSQTVGNVLVTATYGSYSGSTVIDFVSPYTVTFTTTPSSIGGATTVLTVDGQTYTGSQLPVTFGWTLGSTHVYSYTTTISGSSGSQYVTPAVSGCGVSSTSGEVVMTTNCLVSATYAAQYSLTLGSNPPGLGTQTATPSLLWYNSGQSVSLTETPPAGWTFEGWQGTGTGSSTTSSSSTSIVMDSAITETAQYTEFYSLAVSTDPSPASTYNPDVPQPTCSINGGTSTTANCNGSYPSGTSVTISATVGTFFCFPSQVQQFYKFDSAATPGFTQVGCTESESFTLTSNTNVVVTYEIYLSTAVNPEGTGTVSGYGWYVYGGTPIAMGFTGIGGATLTGWNCLIGPDSSGNFGGSPTCYAGGPSNPVSTAVWGPTLEVATDTSTGGGASCPNLAYAKCQVPGGASCGIATCAATLTQAQVQSCAAGAGFNTKDQNIMTGIAGAESTYYAGAWNCNDANGGSYGIFQINGASSALNPTTAASLAYEKYEAASDSFSPWSTYTDGAYCPFIPGGSAGYPNC